MKVLYLGSNERKNAGEKVGQDWSKICWKQVENGVGVESKLG